MEWGGFLGRARDATDTHRFMFHKPCLKQYLPPLKFVKNHWGWQLSYGLLKFTALSSHLHIFKALNCRVCPNSNVATHHHCSNFEFQLWSFTTEPQYNISLWIPAHSFFEWGFEVLNKSPAPVHIWDMPMWWKSFILISKIIYMRTCALSY